MNALMNLLSNWKRWPFNRYVDKRSQNMIFDMCTVVWWHIVGVQPRAKDNDKGQ